MIARSFTKKGIDQFILFIRGIKQCPEKFQTDLNTEPYSKEFEPQFKVEKDAKFNTRMQMAKYLVNKIYIAGVDNGEVLGGGKEGLWTWLSYLWFDQITKERTYIREISKYICSSDYRDYYRHYIATSFYLYSVLGEENARLFLYSSPYRHNDYIEQLASRQYIISYPDLVKTAHILYWEDLTNSPKRGAQSRKRAGNHRRFTKIISQLELTFDIYSMKCEEILNILPKEFDQWKN